MMTRIRRIGVVGLVTVVASCGGEGPTEPAAVPKGKINITVSTAGVHFDLNGYVVWVDSQPIGVVAVNGSLTIEDVSIGNHVVRLDGLALNCMADGSTVREVDVTATVPIALSFSVACVRTGLLAYANTLDLNLYLINSDGTGSSRIGPLGAQHPAWSPNGSRIAFDVHDQGGHEIHVIDGDGSSHLRLTAGSYDHSPAWSPDGGRIAFVRNVEGNAEIFVMSSDGSALVRLTSNSAYDSDPAWSPDGSRIAFTSSRGTYEGIYLMNPDGSAVTRLTPPNVSDSQPSWSPDGSAIVFSRQGRAIFTMKADGSDQVRLTQDFTYAGAPTWSADGQIAFATEISCRYIPFYQYDCVGELLIIRADGTIYTLLNSGNTHDPVWRP